MAESEKKEGEVAAEDDFTIGNIQKKHPSEKNLEIFNGTIVDSEEEKSYGEASQSKITSEEREENENPNEKKGMSTNSTKMPNNEIKSVNSVGDDQKESEERRQKKQDITIQTENSTMMEENEENRKEYKKGDLVVSKGEEVPNKGTIYHITRDILEDADEEVEIHTRKRDYSDTRRGRSQLGNYYSGRDKEEIYDEESYDTRREKDRSFDESSYLSSRDKSLKRGGRYDEMSNLASEGRSVADREMQEKSYSSRKTPVLTHSCSPDTSKAYKGGETDSRKDKCTEPCKRKVTCGMCGCEFCPISERQLEVPCKSGTTGVRKEREETCKDELSRREEGREKSNQRIKEGRVNGSGEGQKKSGNSDNQRSEKISGDTSQLRNDLLAIQTELEVIKACLRFQVSEKNKCPITKLKEHVVCCFPDLARIREKLRCCFNLYYDRCDNSACWRKDFDSMMRELKEIKRELETMKNYDRC